MLTMVMICSFGTMYGFNTFPYAATQTAIDNTFQIAKDYGKIYVVQLDDGIPWHEALYNLPYPSSVVKKWNDLVRRKPAGYPVYLALSPLGADRTNLIGGVGDSANPAIFSGYALNNASVIQAYTNYALKAMSTFYPSYVNLGLEAGALAYLNPTKWPQFETLFKQVNTTVKSKYFVSSGISFILQYLMQPNVLARCGNIISQSNYVGISFYPYLSKFYERFGAAPLNSYDDGFNFLANSVTTKPIAICETGYSSCFEYLPKYSLMVPGSTALQTQYLTELKKKNYLFVVWFAPVDYPQLFTVLPKGDGSYMLWQHIGLFDQNLNPKPAWSVWCAQ